MSEIIKSCKFIGTAILFIDFGGACVAFGIHDIIKFNSFITCDVFDD